jgi:hypothetical protein
MLPALSLDGMVALKIFEGSVTKERFIRFLKEQVVNFITFNMQPSIDWTKAPVLTPYPGKQSVVVLDNCAIHHDMEIWHIVVEDCCKFTTSQ